MSESTRLIGPFAQLLPMSDMPLKGPITADGLPILQHAGVLIESGRIKEIGPFNSLSHGMDEQQIEYLETELVGIPGLIDAHTHICYAGSRARDYAMRVSGNSYLEIAKEGGGIWDSVQQTRAASKETLVRSILARIDRHSSEGVTTCEVKSGYGLSIESEINMLEAVEKANEHHPIDLIPTCLAAHICPREFQDDPEGYLDHIASSLFPILKEKQLSNRIDIFVEEGAFTPQIARRYLTHAKSMGFSLTIHADQFHSGGSEIAVELGAVSADHLEASGSADIARLAASDVVSVALPGASLGLGEPFAPARALLDAGACVAIASDWNPGSAPMGDLLIQAAILGAHESLSIAETLAGLSFRAAAALELRDRGRLVTGSLADIIAFPSQDYRDILYYQGKMKPIVTWKRGKRL